MSLDMNSLTSKVIQTGTVIGIVILAIGLLLSGTDIGNPVLTAGCYLLVLTPLAGVLTSMACLFKNGDKKWGFVAVALVAVVAIGLAITVLV